MAVWVKNHLVHTPHSVFHHGLIKLLIVKELEKKQWNWTHFLLWSSFKVERTSNAEVQERKETPMKLRSYNKRKNIAKIQQGIEYVKDISYVDVKADSGAEKMVMMPNTPVFVEEILVVESMGTTSISEHEFQVIEKTYDRIRDVETVKCRPKTKPTNKFHLNTKRLLNPRIQEEKMI